MSTRLLSKTALYAGITAAALAVADLVPSGAMASTLTVDRGLPTTNLNNAAGTDRSNVAWAFPNNNWLADTFNLATAGTIDKLTVWVITPGAFFGDTYGDLSLYLGSTSSTQIGQVSSATFAAGSNASSNANVSVSAATYSDGESYQGFSGDYLQLWQIDFTNLGAYAAGSYAFALTGATSGSQNTFVHASNQALGGGVNVPANGWDNIMYEVTGADGASDLSLVGSFDSANVTGWGKSTDFNVLVYTSPVPLPATLPLLASGLGALGGISMLQRRRRKRKAAA